jgi:GTP cyclohydrolase III
MSATLVGDYGDGTKDARRDRILQQLHNDLCADLDRIKARFIGAPKVSLVVRFDEPEKGIWLTDDTADSAIEYIRYMEAKNAEERK